MRILFTGSRRMLNVEPIRLALKELFWGSSTAGPYVFVHGGAPGCDLLVEDIAYEFGATIERHDAEWSRYGSSAGPKRNLHMVSLGADLCLAFPCPKSKGTWDCVRKAAGAGIPVRVYGVLSEAPSPLASKGER